MTHSDDNGIWRRVDFRLNSEELAVFKQNGFVVSERLLEPSFASLFYSIYSRDLPVFVSSDALLHAWHRSYDAMLEELEENYLTRSHHRGMLRAISAIPSATPQALNMFKDNGKSLLFRDTLRLCLW